MTSCWRRMCSCIHVSDLLWLNVRRNQPEPSAGRTLDPDCWFLQNRTRHNIILMPLQFHLQQRLDMLTVADLPERKSSLPERPRCPSAPTRPSRWRSASRRGRWRWTWSPSERPRGWFPDGCNNPEPAGDAEETLRTKRLKVQNTIKWFWCSWRAGSNVTLHVVSK